MENALSAVKKKIDKDIIAKHVWRSAMNIQEKVGHFGGHTIFARNVAKNGFSEPKKCVLLADRNNMNGSKKARNL